MNKSDLIEWKMSSCQPAAAAIDEMRYDRSCIIVYMVYIQQHHGWMGFTVSLAISDPAYILWHSYCTLSCVIPRFLYLPSHWKILLTTTQICKTSDLMKLAECQPTHGRSELEKFGCSLPLPWMKSMGLFPHTTHGYGTTNLIWRVILIWNRDKQVELFLVCEFLWFLVYFLYLIYADRLFWLAGYLVIQLMINSAFISCWIFLLLPSRCLSHL